MKKVLYLCFVAVIVFACKDDDHAYEVLTLPIVKSEVDFEAVGGVGTIEVDTKEAVSVEDFSADWCSVTVSGNIITVTAAPASSIEGRTVMLRISSGGKNTAIPITQLGTVFSINETSLAFTLAGGERTINVLSNMPVTVNIPVDWATYNIEGDSIKFTIDPSQSVRSTKAIIICGPRSEEVEIAQIPSYADFLGEWTMYYSDLDADLTDLSRVVTLEQNVINQSFKLNGIPVITNGEPIPFLVAYNPSNGRLVISGGQQMGTYTIGGATYYVSLTLLGGTSLTWSSTVQYEAALDLTQPALTYRFSDNGSWSYPVHGIFPAFFSAATPSAATYAGGFFEYDNIVLVKNTTP